MTKLELAERAVIALERIAGALAGPLKPIVPDFVLAADLAAGLSLRQCAKKHGVGVGRVRGAALRTPADEVERLREALKNIASGAVPGDPNQAQSLFMNARKLALAALRTPRR